MATIEVSEDALAYVVRVAHAATRQAAIGQAAAVQALRGFAERHDPSKLIPLLGTFEDMALEEAFGAMRGDHPSC